MSRSTGSSSPISRLVDGLARGLRGRRIVIVEPGRPLPLALQGVSGASITIARFDAITRDFLAEQSPDVILAPLFSEEHDILDLARTLARAEYAGALRAYSAPLPAPGMIRGEVAQIWPGGDFDIFELPNPPPEGPEARPRGD